MNTPAQAAKRQLVRDQRTTLIGLTSSQVLGPNPRRHALIISCPEPDINQELNSTAIAQGVDTSTTGVKLSYTVPAGTQATLQSVTCLLTAGVWGLVLIQLTRGGTTVNLAAFAANGVTLLNMPLSAGDIIKVNNSSAGAAGVTDFALGIIQDQVSNRVTIDFSGSAAVLDTGLNIYPGNDPLVIIQDHIGQAITEPVQAISASAGMSITILDISEVNCPCQY